MPRDDRWEDLLPLFDEDSNKEDVGIGVAYHGRRSSSYYRLPDPLLLLSVRKLDGSSFDVQIARTAYVRELKLAVEKVFTQLPMEGGIHISWSHVWGNFCLSYNGEKLIDDGASLRSLRIRDGDQLCFIRHLSINYSPIRWQSRNHELDLEKRHRRTMTAPDVLQKIEESGMNKNQTSVDPDRRYADDKLYVYEENESLVRHKESRLSHFLLRWLSCTGLQRPGRTNSEVRTRSSRTGANV